MDSPFEMSDDTPVYVISVAAQLSGLHPQTLRAYDRMGLVCPGRSAGRGRRYSLRDILMLREVQRLSQEEGVNLSGIKRILELEGELERFRRAATEMNAETAQLRAELESTRAVAARLAGLLRNRTRGAELVPVKGLRAAHPPGGARDRPGRQPGRPSLPAAVREPTGAQEPGTGREPGAAHEPGTGQEPGAAQEPGAGREPAASPGQGGAPVGSDPGPTAAPRPAIPAQPVTALPAGTTPAERG